jgi:hypothetical protein
MGRVGSLLQLCCKYHHHYPETGLPLNRTHGMIDYSDLGAGVTNASFLDYCEKLILEQVLEA